MFRLTPLVLFFFSLIVFPSCSSAYAEDELVEEKRIVSKKNWDCFVHDSSIYKEGWATLPQIKYWQTIMEMDRASGMVSIKDSREMLGVIPMSYWDDMTPLEKRSCQDSIRIANRLADSIGLFVTFGRNFFYKFENVKPFIPKAIDVFNENNLNPWYAQAILLIESPGQVNQKSIVGANGPFQLMAAVARDQGLVVNKTVDERTDIVKSSKAAALLLKRICIPHVKRMLEKYDLTYNESDLWFRLLVLHAYHAGSGNLAGVLRTINPTEGGMKLIKKVWTTNYKAFRYSSQSYSQLSLAAYCLYHKMLADEDVTN